jgi:two-component system, chemotaxis family, sensor kinase CheA
LNKQRILEKAIKTGLVDAGQEITDDEIYKLIFHAGLSTAEVITSVSGRGVGMDVVKKNIEALRGRIDIGSIPGKGTVFTITLPLTLAIIDGQIARIGDERFIVPINTIIRSLKPDQSHISSVQGKGKLFMERGQLIPFVELGKLFGINSDSTESIVIIVEAENRKCCLQVDKLLGQQQVVIKNLSEGIGKVAGISGGAIMGDGKISLILDVPGIIDLAQK